MSILKRLNFKVIIPTCMLLLLLFSVYAYYNHAETNERGEQQVTKHKLLAMLMQKVMMNMHYAPKKINNQASKEIFALYLKRLDYDKQFFLKSDIKTLNAYKDKIDDELYKGDFKFYQHALDIREERIKQAIEVLDKVIAQKINFTKNDFFESDKKKRNYPHHQEAFNQFWRKKIKFLILENIYVQRTKKSKAQKKDNSVSILNSVTAEEIADAKKKVARNMRSYFKRLNNQKQQAEYDFNVFLDAVVNIFDPHSSYFPPQQKQDFDIDMSGTLEGIGAVLTEEDGYIKVMRIIPGSASYRQKELKAGDLIIKVGQAHNEPENVEGMSVHDVVKLIRGKKGTLVTLTVRRDDGNILNIPIVRNTVIIQDTYAKSTVISNKLSNQQQYGYIDLPKFYHNFKSEKGRRSADDVKKEIIALKKRRIEGLILDLRSNGGGALQDAVEMSGLFIKEGPIVQVMDGKKNVRILRDTDKDVLYEGVLIVMINEYSASASEILAAALKDYGRAIIIGQNTFGKGTVQQVLPLDNMVPFIYKNYRPLGSMMVTIQKFYRINGKSTQFKGVDPHIVFNIPFNNKDKEKFLEYALGWDEINPSSYQAWQIQSPLSKDYNALLKKLKSKSEQRMKKNLYYHAIIESNKKNDKDTIIPLNTKQYFAKQKEKLQIFNRLDDLRKHPTDVYLAISDAELQNAEPYMESWYEDIKKDHFLAEAVNILVDIKQM